MVLILMLIVTFNTHSYSVLLRFSYSHGIVLRGLISPATANEPMIDVLFYFVTFINILAHCASVSCIINEMKWLK